MGVLSERPADIVVAAPAKAVYRLIADVEEWPRVFEPTVHVERLEGGDRQERLRIWATANGTARTWVSRRDLDSAAMRVRFRQERSQRPVGGMSGMWVVEPLPGDRCHVRLFHGYHAATGDPAELDWIDRAVHGNSRAELSALAAYAEAAHAGPGPDGGPLLTFDETVDVDGRARDVYEFLNEAHLWQERLPHVARVVLDEPSPGLQVLDMDTRTKDGAEHTTRSVRVCLPDTRIVYKQIQAPAPMSLHTGSWLIDERPGGVSVTSRHTVRIDEANLGSSLGDDAGLADARRFVREALGANSRVTLRHAKSYAEERA
ncbi:aromatase/cyclase [Actinomadura fulvescens]|uniref:SRPBCC family protein n=1 Tax=Actinomadura fulvescens TaxID=46160 RepID=A0ABN3QXK8_9ACTN